MERFIESKKMISSTSLSQAISLGEYYIRFVRLEKKISSKEQRSWYMSIPAYIKEEITSNLLSKYKIDSHLFRSYHDLNQLGETGSTSQTPPNIRSESQRSPRVKEPLSKKSKILLEKRIKYLFVLIHSKNPKLIAESFQTPHKRSYNNLLGKLLKKQIFEKQGTPNFFSDVSATHVTKRSQAGSQRRARRSDVALLRDSISRGSPESDIRSHSYMPSKVRQSAYA